MYDGNRRWSFINPPSGNSKSMDTSLLGHPVIPPRHGQVDKHNIQAPVRNKGIKCTYSKVLRIIVTHTMIPRIIASWSKNHLSCRTKPKVMDVVDAAEKVEALKEDNAFIRGMECSVAREVMGGRGQRAHSDNSGGHSM
jgi:hypothetical protein